MPFMCIVRLSFPTELSSPTKGFNVLPSVDTGTATAVAHTTQNSLRHRGSAHGKVPSNLAQTDDISRQNSAAASALVPVPSSLDQVSGFFSPSLPRTEPTYINEPS